MSLVARTQQEILDQVVMHLRRQQRRASGHQRCMYHASNGDMCAIGCLIDKEDYDATYEGLSLSRLIDRMPFFHPLRRLLLRHFSLLKKLQWVHDELDPRSWEAAFARVAGDHKLTLPPRDAP